ncbi:Hypothetical predicted protein [Mytilus galloprovincialis]|uniref:Uncharacterized protein n=1 Tax=Mytilus galloprovincialis TaxID=29158 RepID=A0A8B6FEL7_MYTGA|nr:Hypothetical predicted protein [Mytilus galloprovincialis]
MLDTVNVNDNMTVEMCVQLCMGNRYLGLQYSFECFCGDSWNNSDVYNETNDSECNLECQGNSSQICGGDWRNSVYQYKNCTSPGLNEFTVASINTNVVPSTEVTYTCEFGYQLPAGDLGTRICQLGGTWLAPPPACKVIKCTAPEINEFTITSTNTDVVQSTEVTYTCEFGYQLPAGELGTRICQLGGTWSAPPPACEVTPTSTEEIMTSEVISIATSTISPLECLCPCSQVGKSNWGSARGMNLTFEELRKVLRPDINFLKKELSVNKSNTNRMRRSKISAPDDRVSATSVGYVGVVFICLITVLIVLFDILGKFK